MSMSSERTEVGRTEGPELALRGSRLMVCSRKEQQKFLKGVGSSVRDPMQTARVPEVMALIDIFEGRFEGAEGIACVQ